VLCGSLDNLANAFAHLDEKALSEASPLARDNRDADLKRRVRTLLERDANLLSGRIREAETFVPPTGFGPTGV